MTAEDRLNAIAARNEALNSEPLQLHAEDYTPGPGFLAYGSEPDLTPEPNLIERLFAWMNWGMAALAIASVVLFFMLITPTFNL